MYSNIVLSGGGLACVASFACVRALARECGNAKTLVGASAGAIVAALIALDADETSTRRTILQGVRALSQSSAVSLTRIFSDLGAISSRDVLAPFVETLVMDAYRMAQIAAGHDPSPSAPTFRDFALLTGKNLMVAAVDVDTGRLVAFSVDSHPRLSVIDAITASCALPFLSTPVEIDGHLFVDAAMTDNLPLAPVADRPAHETLAIDFACEDEAPHPNTARDILSFARALINTLVTACNDRAADVACDRITIDVPHKAAMHLDTALGRVQPAQIDALLDAGVRAAASFRARRAAARAKVGPAISQPGGGR